MPHRRVASQVTHCVASAPTPIVDAAIAREWMHRTQQHTHTHFSPLGFVGAVSQSCPRLSWAYPQPSQNQETAPTAETQPNSCRTGDELPLGSGSFPHLMLFLRSVSYPLRHSPKQQRTRPPTSPTRLPTHTPPSPHPSSVHSLPPTPWARTCPNTGPCVRPQLVILLGQCLLPLVTIPLTFWLIPGPFFTPLPPSPYQSHPLVQGAGCRVQGAGCRVQGEKGLRVSNPLSRVDARSRRSQELHQVRSRPHETFLLPGHCFSGLSPN